MPQTKISRRACYRGLSLIELLVSLAILLVIMVGVAGLLESSWQSFSDLKWQNRVDSEARRALDAISDSARVSGGQIDFYKYTKRSAAVKGYNINKLSTSANLNLTNDVNQNGTESYAYNSFPDPASGRDVGFLQHSAFAFDYMAAVYITNVNFAYEYREVSQPGDTQWTFDTVQGLQRNQPATDPTNGAIYYTVKTIYITVTASYNPYPNSIDSRTYTRTLTGAVTLRAPYSTPLPPAQIDGP